MKRTKLVSVLLAFLLILTSSVGVFAEDTQTNLMTAEMITLRDNIAELIKDTEDGWTAMDMAAYETIPETTAKMSDETKQKILNSYIQEAIAEDTTASDRARIEIVLKSIGIDSKELYVLSSETPFDNGAALKSSHITSNHYAAPWILLADILGNTELDEEQKTSLVDLLNTNSSGGNFGYEWEGVVYPDYDTAAAVLSAVAPVYQTNDTARSLADGIIESIETNITETGSFGSANTDAMVIIGYIAMGKNPADLKHAETEKTVIDGLMSYVNTTNNRFTYYGQENYLATEQGLRALIALSKFSGTPYNIYDFSQNETVAGRETDSDEGGEVTPPAENSFNVTLTIEAENTKWIDDATVTLSENATVYDAFISALSDTGITQEGAEEGHITSITKDNVTYSAVENGETYGWFYKVNDVKSDVSIKEYVLAENDKIVFYYVKKPHVYTGGGYVRPSRPVKEPEKEAEKEPEETPEEIPEETPSKVFADTKDHWASEAVSYVSAQGIMQGIDENNFAPDEKLTRGMLVTMLFRLNGSKTVESDTEFNDVKDEVWYKDAVDWAVFSGIADGLGDGIFGADENITREQLAVFLMRYTELCGIDTSIKEETTEDKEVSEWAKDALQWVQENRLISGYDDGKIYPKNNATRAEIAMVFMRYIQNIIK